MIILESGILLLGHPVELSLLPMVPSTNRLILVLLFNSCIFLFPESAADWLFKPALAEWADRPYQQWR